MSRERAQAMLCEGFGSFGKIHFPYVVMGRIDSLHLFGDTELMLFAMYQHNRSKWRRALDIGANLGLHSILMAKCGMSVKAFEPDFEHFAKLLENIRMNDVFTRVAPQMAAVHTMNGSHEFVRVLNNLTGNHLLGYKEPYGPLESVVVPTVDARPLWDWAQFAKIDSEGNEAELCKTMTAKDMRHLQVVLEVRNTRNAGQIYRHFEKLDVPLWSQKTRWAKVESMKDMPQENRQGSVFIGHEGPWG